MMKKNRQKWVILLEFYEGRPVSKTKYMYLNASCKTSSRSGVRCMSMFKKNHNLEVADNSGAKAIAVYPYSW